jgi:hypothetical protein
MIIFVGKFCLYQKTEIVDLIRVNKVITNRTISNSFYDQ